LPGLAAALRAASSSAMVGMVVGCC
jgi:hypothetical protein